MNTKAPSNSASTRSSVRRHLLAAGSLSTILLLGVGVWAGTTEISGAVIVPGVVVVETNVKRVQHPTGGIVTELRVQDGAEVKQGDLLIGLDATQASVNLAILSKSLDEITVRQIRLEAERDELQTLIYPSRLSNRASIDLDFERLLDGEQKLFQLRFSARSGQQEQLRERISQLREQIKGLEEQLRAKKTEMDLIEVELKGVRDLYEKNLIPIQRFMALKRESARLAGERGGLVAAIAQAQGRISETELQVIQIGQDLRSEVGKELADLRAKLAELSERKIAAEDQLRRVAITSPSEGVVHQLAAHTIGGIVAPGETLMLIVPHGEALSVEARLAPEGIDQVRVGQKAIMRFPAFNQRTTPEVNGVVRRVSADLTTDQRTGIVYYQVRLDIPDNESARLQRRIQPGMPVEAFIQTGDRTVITYLTKPLSDQMMRAFRER